METIKVSSDVYMRIIAGKAVQVPTDSVQLDIGKRYNIVNISTKTYMQRYLTGILGDYVYWGRNKSV